MSHIPLTYRDLFALLRSLGFQERRASTRGHVFFHEGTDTILAFGRNTDELVTPADTLSTEVHLHAKGIAHQSLASLVGEHAANRR